MEKYPVFDKIAATMDWGKRDLASLGEGVHSSAVWPHGIGKKGDSFAVVGNELSSICPEIAIVVRLRKSLRIVALECHRKTPLT